MVKKQKKEKKPIKFSINKKQIELLIGKFEGIPEKYILTDINEFIEKVNKGEIILKDINFISVGSINRILFDEITQRINLYFEKGGSQTYSIDIKLLPDILYKISDSEIFLLDINVIETSSLPEKLLNSRIKEVYDNGISLSRPLFKKKHPINTPFKLTNQRIAELRINQEDHLYRQIKHELKNLYQINIDYFNRHIIKLKEYEIELLKKKKRIDKCKLLLDLIKTNRISISRKQNSVSIKIDKASKGLSIKDLKIKMYGTHEFDTYIILTKEEIDEIIKKVNDKYEKIKNDIERELMPPPNRQIQLL